MTIEISDHIQVSDCGNTVWVHGSDGSTIGRFSKIFGMDVHRTASEQMEGMGQCLHCTHTKPTQTDWLEFCTLMSKHYGMEVSTSLMSI